MSTGMNPNGAIGFTEAVQQVNEKNTQDEVVIEDDKYNAQHVEAAHGSLTNEKYTHTDRDQDILEAENVQRGMTFKVAIRTYWPVSGPTQLGFATAADNSVFRR